MATGLNALSAILPQVIALLTLGPESYGRFSMVYLVYAAGASSIFSVICDAWSRTAASQTPHVGWREYSGAVVAFSSIFGLTGLVIGFVVGVGWLNAVLGGLAVAALVNRTGSRYWETRVGAWGHVLWGDLASVLATAVSFTVGWLARWDPLLITVMSWAAGSVASTLASLPPVLNTRHALRRWIAVHREAIRPLLSDSLLLDIGAIGTPYLIAPLLGLGPFGLYRAVANVATPVQLVLNPLRPLVTGSNRERLLSPRLLFPLTAALIAAGVACYWVLILLPGLPFRLGVLSDLHQVAVPASLFVPANGLSFYVYLVARGHAPAARIVPARVAQTVFAVSAPLVGALGWGLPGAVWGFSGSACLFVALWWVAVAWPDGSHHPNTRR